jgi:orotidine-5'-phosphate decarboxylase
MHEHSVPILALDDMDMAKALAFTRLFGSRCHAVKIHELFERYGAGIMDKLMVAGAKRIMVDAKIHQPPHAAARLARIYSTHGAAMITVHATGGIEMMKRAREAFAGQVFAVTCLSTQARPSLPRLKKLALDARSAGIRSVVCPGRVVLYLSSQSDLRPLVSMVPDIRLAIKDRNDHKDPVSPESAVTDKATHVVFGSPITKAKDPEDAFEVYLESVRRGLRNVSGEPESAQSLRRQIAGRGR